MSRSLRACGGAPFTDGDYRGSTGPVKCCFALGGEPVEDRRRRLLRLAAASLKDGNARDGARQRLEHELGLPTRRDGVREQLEDAAARRETTWPEALPLAVGRQDHERYRKRFRSDDAAEGAGVLARGGAACTVVADAERPRIRVHPPVPVEDRVLVGVVDGSGADERRRQRRLAGEGRPRQDDRAAAPTDDAGVD